MLYAVSAPNSCISYPRSASCPHFLRKRSIPARLSIRASLPDNNNGAKMEYTPWLIVGLGNPGNKYHGTRHNVGFEMVDSISQAVGISLNTIQSKALIGIGSIGEVPILLAKPQAYMNYSGEAPTMNLVKGYSLGGLQSLAYVMFILYKLYQIFPPYVRKYLGFGYMLIQHVGPLAAYYQVPLRHILLVYDEMSLPNGVLRLQQKGGHGHHNGMRSVMGHLDGCRQFPRLCIGIGNPPGTMDLKAFLLQKFSSVERKQIDAALEQGVEAVKNLVLHGFSQSTDRFNLGQKYKYHKV